MFEDLKETVSNKSHNEISYNSESPSMQNKPEAVRYHPSDNNMWLNRPNSGTLRISPGYLLIYPPQMATVMKPLSFCSKYNPVSHTKSLGESREWNMVFQGSI